ncbi:uncharacterized protein METZ01_LOCUS307202, partial [marine metagenome]
KLIIPVILYKSRTERWEVGFEPLTLKVFNLTLLSDCKLK